jgi:hypothetical protein
MKMVADRMVADGYRDAGYTAVNLDSCWWDAANPRDAGGHLQVPLYKSDYIGLGTRTCSH